MSMTDPISDLLTRVRNAQQARHSKVDVPSSRMKLEIVRVMKDEGYIEEFSATDDSVQGLIHVRFKALQHDGKPTITGLERVSRPGRRVYCGKDEIPRVLGGLGVCIVSTSKGVMSGSACRAQGIGGEILCNIW